MTGLDSDTCAVKWCHEAPLHVGVHRRYLGEVMLSGRQGITSIHLTVESHEATSRPKLVITISITISITTTEPMSSAVMTCAQADVLRALLAEGIERSTAD